MDSHPSSHNLAAVMVGVFLVFVTLQFLDFKDLPSWLEWLPRIGGEDPPPADRPGPDVPEGTGPAPLPA